MLETENDHNFHCFIYKTLKLGNKIKKEVFLSIKLKTKSKNKKWKLILRVATLWDIGYHKLQLMDDRQSYHIMHLYYDNPFTG